MQIVIPMSGYGERFRAAGYTVPKPLIEIDGKPIIEYVVGMFPGENDFLFIIIIILYHSALIKRSQRSESEVIAL